MIRIVFACDGVPADAGPAAAADIEQEFRDHRQPRYTNAVCTFQNGQLLLSCDNDGWDREGRNMLDEFSDCISACIETGFDGDIRLISVTAL